MTEKSVEPCSNHKSSVWLYHIDQLFYRIESFSNLLGGIAIVLVVTLSTINVLGRWLFNLPIDGYIDWTEQLMAPIAFLGVAYAMREGKHIRMEMLIKTLKGRLRWFFELSTTLIATIVVAFLIKGSYLHFLRAYTIGDSSVDINLPTWPAKLIVPLALSFLFLRLILMLWGYFRILITNDHTPIALPKDEDHTTTNLQRKIGR